MNDDLPVEQLYALRQRETDQREWDAILSVGGGKEKETPPGAVTVGTAEENLASGAAAATQLGPGKITSPFESASEAVRTRVTALSEEGMVRQGVDAALRTFTGVGLEEVEQAVYTGQLPAKLSMKMLDPGGSLMETLARTEAEKSGVDPETAAQIGSGAGALAGMLFSPPGGKAKKVATEAKALINTARVEAELGVKQTMKAVSELVSERLAGARKTVTHEQTIAEGTALGLTLEQAASLNVEKYDLRAVQQGVRDYHNAASQYLYNVAKATAAGDEKAADRLHQALAVAGELSIRDELLGKTAARGLEARKILSQASRAPFDPADLARMTEMLQGMESSVDPQVLAERILALSPRERKTFAGQTVGALRAGQDALYEVWINALLSGPQTHAANIASNSLTTAWAPGERALSAMLDLGRDRSVFFGESTAMLYGMVEGAADGFRLIGRSLRDRTAPVLFGGDKVERPIALGAARFGLDPNTVTGSAVDYLGMVVRAPGTALKFEDAFFKAVNYRMELRALAYREASHLALDGPDRAVFIRKMLLDPPPEAHARAEQFALAQTFNTELSDIGALGQFAGGLTTAAESVPMGRIVLPFIRTPTNIMHWSMERTPILNGLSDTLRADLASRGERRALAMGKVASGMVLGGVLSSLAAAGLVTGGGPKDANLKNMLRETGWQPYSIRVGESYYSYNRLDPIGATLGIMADYADIAGEIPEGRRAEFALAAGLALSKHMVSKTYLEGVSNVLEAVTAPDRGLDKYIRSLERTLVPTGVRQVTRTMDPTIRETRGLTEVDELLNEIKAGIPGFASDLPPRRNLFGEPVRLKGGWGPDLISPIYSSTVTDDPVAEEIVRQKVRLSLPSQVMGGTAPPTMRFGEERAAEGVRLTPQEYDRLLVLTGQGVGGEPPLRRALADLISRAEYRQATDGPDGGKALLIRTTVNVYKEAAKAQLLQESGEEEARTRVPGLKTLIEQQMRKRIEARDPDVTPPAANRSETGSGFGALIRSLNPR